MRYYKVQSIIPIRIVCFVSSDFLLVNYKQVFDYRCNYVWMSYSRESTLLLSFFGLLCSSVSCVKLFTLERDERVTYRRRSLSFLLENHRFFPWLARISPYLTTFSPGTYTYRTNVNAKVRQFVRTNGERRLHIRVSVILVYRVIHTTVYRSCTFNLGAVEKIPCHEIRNFGDREIII